MAIFEMKTHFRELLVDWDIFNALNVAKLIDYHSPKNREHNIDIVTATAFRLMSDFLAHLEFEFIGRNGKFIEYEGQNDKRRTLLEISLCYGYVIKRLHTHPAPKDNLTVSSYSVFVERFRRVILYNMKIVNEISPKVISEPTITRVNSLISFCFKMYDANDGVKGCEAKCDVLTRFHKEKLTNHVSYEQYAIKFKPIPSQESLAWNLAPTKK